MTRYIVRKREYRRVDCVAVDYEYELTEKDLAEFAEQGLKETDPAFEETLCCTSDWFEDDFKVVDSDRELENLGEFYDYEVNLVKMEE